MSDQGERPGYESDAEAVVRFITAGGLRDLMGSDGCLCGHTQVRGFEISVSCRKSESSLRVTSCVLDVQMRDLAMVATEALAQVRSEDDWSDILVRYCDYGADNKGGRWVDGVWVNGPGWCVYCGKARADRAAYLCADCLVGKDAWGDPIAANYDYALISLNGLQQGLKDD
jgi:hypothetical protein